MLLKSLDHSHSVVLCIIAVEPVLELQRYIYRFYCTPSFDCFTYVNFDLFEKTLLRHIQNVVSVHRNDHPIRVQRMHYTLLPMKIRFPLTTTAHHIRSSRNASDVRLMESCFKFHLIIIIVIITSTSKFYVLLKTRTRNTYFRL